MGLADTARLAADLSLKGNFFSKMSTANRALGKFDANLDRTASRANLAGQQIGRGIQNTGKIVAVGAATLVSVGVASLKTAADFESSLNTINTVARVNEDELEGIGNEIRKIARETGTTTEDLSQGYYDLVSAGVAAKDATGVLVAANTLAIGGLATTAETVDLLTSAINTYKMDASEAGNVADIFAKSIERGKVTADELASSFATVGPIAASSSIGLEELGAAYAQLTAAGVPAAEAATQTRSAIVALTRTTKPLEALQKATGRNYLKLAGRKGLVFALETLRKDADKAGVPLIELLGRVEGLNFVLGTTGPNFESYNDNLRAMGDAQGTAAEQMAERQKGLNHQLAILKANAKDAGITIGSALLPKITPLVKRFNEFVSTKQPDIEKFADQFAGLFTDDNIAAGAEILEDLFDAAKDAAPAIAASAKITGQVIGTAVSMFNTLPKELQALAISGLAINKLTGGLVTNIAGGLIGSVVKQLKSNLVNVHGGVVNVSGGAGAGGAAGGAAAAAGGGSKIGKVAGAAFGAVTIVGSALAVLETQKAVSEQNTQASRDIRDRLQQVLATSPKGEQLRTQLAAVETGIAQIRSNPLHMLVQGEALTNLQQMRGSLLRQIEATQGLRDKTDAGQQRNAERTEAVARQVTENKRETQRGLSAVKASNARGLTEVSRKTDSAKQTISERVRAGAAQTARETSRGTSIQSAVARSEGSQTRATIRGARPIVNVSLRVNATHVTQAVKVQNQYGSTGGSRNVDGDRSDE